MIRYALACDSGHEFESWFRDSAAYDMQRAEGFVSCPFCGSERVEKAVMAPNVARKDRTAAAPGLVEADAPAAGTAPPLAASAGTPPAPALSDKDRLIREMVREVHARLTENADYVGPSFAEEARRIHEGEAEERPIWGEATLEEAKELIEDGIPAMPIPLPPDERN
jgi:hypothetical protein